MILIQIVLVTGIDLYMHLQVVYLAIMVIVQVINQMILIQTALARPGDKPDDTDSDSPKYSILNTFDINY
jgi:hypothetical protein